MISLCPSPPSFRPIRGEGDCEKTRPAVEGQPSTLRGQPAPGAPVRLPSLVVMPQLAQLCRTTNSPYFDKTKKEKPMLRKRHIARSAIKSAIIAHTAKRLFDRRQHAHSHGHR